MVIFYFLLAPYLVQAQLVTEFTPDNQFAIPTKNGNINFAVNGTYAQAKLENDTWIFSELKLANSPTILPHLQVSTQDCNITILSYRRFTSLENRGSLLYNVTGQGIQTFKFNLISKDREWSVISNGNFLPEGKGWHLADDETLTITNQAINITIFYMNLPSDISDNSIPFYQRHSVAIGTGIIVAIVTVTAIIVRIKNQKTNNTEDYK